MAPGRIRCLRTRRTTNALPGIVSICGPEIAPVLADIAARHAGKVKVVKVNVDDEPALAARFDARSIPLPVVLDGRG